MNEKEVNAIRRCNELTNESHSCWIGLTNQDAIQTVIDMVLNQDKSICNLKNKVLEENNARNQAENKYEELLSKFSPIYDIEKEKEIKKLKKIISLMAETLSAIETDIPTIKKQFKEKYCEFMNSNEDCCWMTDRTCSDCIIKFFENIAKEK